jgi:hypothetical protein
MCSPMTKAHVSVQNTSKVSMLMLVVVVVVAVVVVAQ